MNFKRIFKLLREISSVRYRRAEEKEKQLKRIKSAPAGSPDRL